MSDYDSPWKEALDCYFESFLAFFFPTIFAEIDWTRSYETLDKELQQVVREAELGRRVVDKLVRVWHTKGQEEWLLIHIEVQSQEEADFPMRMFVYNYRLFDRYNRPVVSLTVLGDDRPHWRPDHFGYSVWGCSVGIHFPVIKLLDYAAAEQALESNPNPFATVVLAHLKTAATRRDQETRRAWKVRLVKGLYDRGLSREDVSRLFRFIDWMMNLPEELENSFWQEVSQYEQEKHMPYVTSVERMGIEKGRQEGLQEGRQEGLQEGRQEGLQEGRQEGLQEGILEAIDVVLKVKFGQVGVQLLPELRRIKDVEKLRTVLKEIEAASALDEVRRLL